MFELTAHVGDLFRAHNAPLGHAFGDGVVATVDGDPFTNTAGVLTNPTVVLARTQRPDSLAESTLTFGVDVGLVRDATGIYYWDTPFDVAGRWYFRLVGQGVVTAAIELEVLVAKSAFRTP